MDRILELTSFSRIVPKKKAKSCVWKYFGLPADENELILTADSAICNMCNTPVSSKGGNTSNLMSHLRKYHPLEYSKIAGESHSNHNLSEQTGHLTNGNLGKSSKSQDTIKDLPPSELATKNCTDSVTKFLVTTMQPYKIVEDQSFINMLKVLNPRYKLPGRKHFSNITIPKLYNDTRQKIRQELAGLNDNTHVAITTDCWTSITNIPYIGVTAHFISYNWTLKSVCLSCTHCEEDHNYEDIAEILKTILSDWNIDLKRISAFTTENGFNMLKAIEKIELPHIPCFGHNISIGINRALELPELKKALIRLKTLKNTITHSWKMERDLAKAQELLQIDVKPLPSACFTNWLSIFKLASRFLQNKLSIYHILLEYPDKKCLMLDESEIAALQDFVSATTSVEDMSKTLSGEHYTSSSSILPLYRQMKKNLQNNDDDSKLLKIIKEEILSALSKYETEPLTSILKLSSLCDPRFRLRFTDSAEEVKKMAIEKMTSIYEMQKSETNENQEERPAKKKKTSLAKLLDDDNEYEENKNLPFKQAELELKNYLAMPKVDLEQNPLQWWKLYDASFPTLKILAKYYLSIQGTSVPSERFFSTGGNIIQEQRVLLSSKNAEMQNFLAQNKEYI